MIQTKTMLHATIITYMSENNSSFSPFTVTINNVPFDIKPYEIKKGLSKGTVKYGPDYNRVTLDDVRNAFGDEKLLKTIIIPRMRALTGGISDEAMGDGELPDEAKFVDDYSRMFTELSSRGESISALRTRRDELLLELVNLTSESNVDPKRIMDLSSEIADVERSLRDKKHKDEEAKPEATASAA